MRWLLGKDLRILRRSPLLVAMLVLYPVLIAALVGFAVTSGPSKPRVAVLNEIPPSQQKIQLGGQQVDVAKEARPLFDSIDRVNVKDRAEAERLVKSGDVLAAVIVPSNITRALQDAAQGAGGSARVEVLYNAEDPAKRRYVENTIKARVQEANTALAKRFAAAGAGYIKVLASGGSLSIGGLQLQVLGLGPAEKILRAVRAKLPRSARAQRAQLDQVIEFAHLGGQNLGYAETLLGAIGTPVQVDSRLLGGSTPLGAFAAAVAAAVTLMFVTLLLASGALALEREENAYRRLVRGLVSQTELIVEKAGLAAMCSVGVGLVLLLGLSFSADLPWSRFPLWVAALTFGALAFGALGVAMGALAREVRAASLLAFMAALPIAVLGLIPSGAVGAGLYDLIRVISALFPFKPALDALESALGRSGGMVAPLLHLTALAVVYGALARIALRRFA
ncbi:MAG: type transport system permease protein [Thermoleophilaceae bacterium]|nr:type transport system permease protein [Thermoleophilaceae bacterium]